jgi:predicted nucleic acid-binding protein
VRFYASVWQQAESLAQQKGRRVQPDALDALHVVFAVNSGCTHFLSYDAHTRQRAFATACGLKVLPERLPN